MRFATLLLLATAVSGLRLTHRAAKPEKPPKELVEAVKFVMKECDTDENGSLDKDEAAVCIKKGQEELKKEGITLPDEYKEKAKKKYEEYMEDGKITPKEIGDFLIMTYEEFKDEIDAYMKEKKE